mgnify:FL=1|tara:strand:- start:21 stop:284 length:264 start_codon:yes stop_codon:yes gene_type:complete
MRVLFSLIIILFFLPGSIYPHSGGLDSQCGHNCSEKSKRKGLCYAYHYHYGNCVPGNVSKQKIEQDSESVVNAKSCEAHVHQHILEV